MKSLILNGRYRKDGPTNPSVMRFTFNTETLKSFQLSLPLTIFCALSIITAEIVIYCNHQFNQTNAIQVQSR